MVSKECVRVLEGKSGVVRNDVGVVAGEGCGVIRAC
jgi:hypothetical protein